MDESSARSSCVCKHFTDNDFDIGGSLQFWSSTRITVITDSNVLGNMPLEYMD